MNRSLTIALVALSVVCIVASLTSSSFASNVTKDLSTKVMNRPFDEGAQVLKKWGVAEIVVLRQGQGQSLEASTTAVYLMVDADGIVRDVRSPETGIQIQHAGVVKVYLQSAATSE